MFRCTFDTIGITSLTPTPAFLEAVKRGVLPVQPYIEGPDPYGLEHWLETYFRGEPPQSLPPLHLIGTPFQLRVWQLLLAIPYGATTTYGALAMQLSAPDCRMSAQAVGQAVGHNPIPILVPCHRILAAHTLGGYAYGLDMKRVLLAVENNVSALVNG